MVTALLQEAEGPQDQDSQFSEAAFTGVLLNSHMDGKGALRDSEFISAFGPASNQVGAAASALNRLDREKRKDV